MKFIKTSLICFSFLMAGCINNIYTLKPNPQSNPVFKSLPEDDLLVGLAISGGGSRAATFTAGTLEELARIPAKEKSLLEKVNYISSVSGGSLATAYFAVKKPSKQNPVIINGNLSEEYQNFFSQYKNDMQKNFELRTMIHKILHLKGFSSPNLAYTFSDIWDNLFFSRLTFTDLYQREESGDSPQIIFNGTSYNNGRRFVLTTLNPADFDYNFARLLNPQGLTTEIPRQLLPITFEEIKGDHQGLPISLAVATSASFPPAVGPVTYKSPDDPNYNHVGDGGIFDNLGLESLIEVFLKKLKNNPEKKGLIIVIDSSYPFSAKNAAMDQVQKGYEVFTKDPTRIVGIMEERAKSYQAMLWNILRNEKIILPDNNHLEIITLNYTEAEWSGYHDLPQECRKEFPAEVTPEQIKQRVIQIPTAFKIDACNGALLLKSAQKVVTKNRKKITDFINQASP